MLLTNVLISLGIYSTPKLSKYVTLSPLTSQPEFKCSKLTTEELEQAVNFWAYFTPCSSVSIFNFEQVNAGWDIMLCNEFLLISTHQDLLHSHIYYFKILDEAAFKILTCSNKFFTYSNNSITNSCYSSPCPNYSFTSSYYSFTF